MKFLAIPCLLVAGMVASPSLADEPDANIEVLAPASVATWSQAVSHELDQNIGQEVKKYRMKGAAPTGVASVRFLCSETGEPTAIEFTRKSPNQQLNSVAKNVVADIKTLHPLPLGVAADQVFVANILVASDDAEYARHMATLREDARRQATMAGTSPQPIAFNAVVRAPG